MNPEIFPDGFAIWASKASIWGRYKTVFKGYNDPLRPKGQNFYNSKFFINIPHELVSKVFKGVPIGGQ